MSGISRREFVRLTAAGAAASPFVAGAAAPTAQEIVDRIKARLGVPWEPTTVDTFKAGDPSTPITGIVTSSLATIDVMRRAVKSGANLIVTSGPTFYSRSDRPTPPAGRGRGTPLPAPPDPLFTAKNEFIASNTLVVWRFSDHWRRHSPDPFVQGLTDALRWPRPAGTDPRSVTISATTLDALSKRVRDSLNVRGGMRIVGQPQMRVRTVTLLPGTVPIQTMLTALPQADVVIAGEIREWESSEYARDMVTSGRSKGLILIGRSLSEDPGMNMCAQWLQRVVPEAPVRFMPAGDPYWRPRA